MGVLSFFSKIFSFGSQTKKLTCIQCRRSFAFEKGEQDFYKKKGLQDPKRCSRCRKQSRNGFRGRKRRRSY